MTPANPYAPPGFTSDRTDSTCIEWEGRQIEVRGEALARRLWSIIVYTITIDETETFSNAQISGVEDFGWHFKHQGRVADARFEPIKWQRRGRQQFRIRIDGDEIACETVAVRGFGCFVSLYMSVLILVFVIAPAGLLALLGLIVS